jgi:hypothetical protein
MSRRLSHRATILLVQLAAAALFAAAPPLALAFSSRRVHRAATVLIESSARTSKAFAQCQNVQSGWTGRGGGRHRHRRPFTNLLATTLEATKQSINSTSTSTSTTPIDTINDTASSSSLPVPALAREEKLKEQMEAQAAAIASEILDENCEVNLETMAPVDEVCVDEVQKEGFRTNLKADIEQIGSLVGGRGSESDVEGVLDVEIMAKKPRSGDALEKGCTSLVESICMVM